MGWETVGFCGMGDDSGGASDGEYGVGIVVAVGGVVAGGGVEWRRWFGRLHERRAAIDTAL